MIYINSCSDNKAENNIVPSYKAYILTLYIAKILFWLHNVDKIKIIINFARITTRTYLWKKLSFPSSWLPS